MCRIICSTIFPPGTESRRKLSSVSVITVRVEREEGQRDGGRGGEGRGIWSEMSPQFRCGGKYLQEEMIKYVCGEVSSRRFFLKYTI